MTLATFFILITIVAKVNYLIDKDDYMDVENIKEIRKFNRSYTRILKLTDKYHLNTHFTLLESRLFLEIDRGVNTANQLMELLQIDKGYLSRVLKRLKNDGLIDDIRGDGDRRVKTLQLTVKGEAALEEDNRRADQQIENLFARIPETELKKVSDDMKEIKDIVKKYSKE